MEKISRILPTSHRFQTAEKSRSQVARPGAIEFGRASAQEVEAAKISVSQLARDILKQAQDEKSQRIPDLITSESPTVGQITEPLVPVENPEAPKSATDTLL